jgi:putative membrane protein
MRKREGEILWLVILLALILIMGKLLVGGDILIFLAPRMVPVVWFGFAVLLLLSVYQFFHIVRSPHGGQEPQRVRPGTFLFLVPVVLLFTVAPDTSTPGALPNQNVRMISLTDERAPEEQSPGADTALDEADDTEDVSGIPPCVLEDETARFDKSADLFSKYLFGTVEDLAGRTVTVYGFVYADDTFPENTVLVARMLISCCAADASIVGFHVKTEDSTALLPNEWIRVTGTVRTIRMPYYGSDYDFPILTDGLIVRCDAPAAEDAYIYP